MKSTLFACISLFVLSIFSPISAQEDSWLVSGRITYGGEPLEGVEIKVKESSERAVTNQKGKYQIRTKEKETLVYSYSGLRTVEIIVEDVTKILNVVMEPELNELDEVVVTDEKLSRQEELKLRHQIGDGVVKSAYGYLDKRSTWHSLKIVEEDVILRSFDLFDVIRKINPGAKQLFDSLTGLTSGICIGRRFSSLNQSCIPAGFDVDGALLTEFPFIPIDQIKRVAVIQGSTGFTRYGRFAAGGVIIIETKTGSGAPRTENGEIYDFAKLRNNIFNGDAKPYYTLNRDSSEYIELMRNAGSKEEAMSIFEERAKVFGTSPDFYFDTASYFLNELQDRRAYVSMLKKIEKEFDDNSNVLKAVAYRYEELGDMDAANDVYVRIFKLRPSYGQSYRDLANSFKKTGDEKMALELVSRYKKAVTDFDIIGDTSGQSEIDSILSTEATSWASTGKVQLKKKFQKSLKNEVWPIRLMVEWNNSDAEFDLQLVNPEGHYYTWSHTLEKNPEFIKEEKIRGFSSKQFYMGSTPPGQWQVNIKYHGNKSFDDTYLKVTAYTNYGSQIQTHTTEVYKLSTKNVNQELMKIATPTQTALTSN